ncbi:unnamed protein product [Schistosoma margrebowiei]|uniref:Uncharacterized protein n=1 Tax=Schistosoma margrebowiei TaxID=48269 RepID=A0A183N1R8_9TREM|nr:unnamed protein product [Schistosoma margrebowiei]
MWETGKTSQIATEMRRYNLAVLGISETHWTQAGQQRLATGEMLLNSGHEEDNAPNTQGVALMLSKVARNALVEWESHGSRIIKASFKTKEEGILMNIIQCYAPTNDSNDDIKHRFYERLQSIIEKFPRKNLTILNGDLNAKVETDNTGYEDIMERLGLAAREGNMKQLHDTTKKLAGKYSKPERPVKDKEGKPITEIQQQQNRWVEYFEELLNRSAPMNPPDIKAAHTDLPVDVNPPTTEEIRMAIRQTKSAKAAGPDNIPAEALKSDIKVTTNMLHLLFRKI